MYDMLMTKKLDNDQKNINILNDKRKNQESKSDLALNLLIVEHLMQRGLWCTASVMVSEADFLLEPPGNYGNKIKYLKFIAFASVTY